MLCFIRDRPKSQTYIIYGGAKFSYYEKAREKKKVLLKVKPDHYLYDPVLIDKKVWRLQITMDYHWCTVMQVIHSTSL